MTAPRLDALAQYTCRTTVDRRRVDLGIPARGRRDRPPAFELLEQIVDLGVLTREDLEYVDGVVHVAVVANGHGDALMTWIRRGCDVHDGRRRRRSGARDERDEDQCPGTHGGLAIPDIGDPRFIECDKTCAVLAIAGSKRVAFLAVADGASHTLDKVVDAVSLAGDGNSFTAVVGHVGTYEILRGAPTDPAAAKRAERATAGWVESVTIDRETGHILVELARSPAELVGEDDVYPITAPSRLRAVAFAGGHLVTAHDDFTVRVWNGPNIAVTLTGVEAPIDGLVVEPREPGQAVGRVVAISNASLQPWSVTPPDHTSLLPKPVTKVEQRRIDHDRSYRVALENDSVLVDASVDGKLVLACDDDVCSTVALRDPAGKVLAKHAGLPRQSWIAAPDWIASGTQSEERTRLSAGDTELRPAHGGAVRPLAGCRARRPDQLWISADARRGVCADERGIAVWAEGRAPRHLFDCRSARITTATDGLLVVNGCDPSVVLVDTIAGTVAPIPKALANKNFLAISEDTERLVVLEEGRVEVSDRRGTLVAQFGRSIEAVEERRGIVYTVDSQGVVAMWDRDNGSLLAQWYSGRGGEKRSFEVRSDGLTIALMWFGPNGQWRLTEWKLPVETRSPEAVVAGLAKNPWVIDRGRLVRRPVDATVTDAPPAKTKEKSNLIDL